MSLLLLTTLLNLTIQDHRTAIHLIRSEQAYYLTEAGLLHAKQHLARHPEWRGQSANIPFGPGTYSYRMDNQSGSIRIESVGEVGNSKYRRTFSASNP